MQMNEDFEQNVRGEVARIEQLELADQPSEFDQLRKLLEETLNRDEAASANDESTADGI